ncbi:glycosyl hydrolase 108 family protein [Mesorhizobium sp. M0296]|uniref:glycoside hydrolase family 108 protein n=1 Tax=Mesorhizobium sp. M0296 TaxID=2956931 RepID=UPI00333BE62C
MASGNLSACLKVSLAYEGGWSDHPKDPGGATMKGITLATFRRYKPGASKTQLRNISQTDVEFIYRDGFWTPIRGDALPFGIDMGTFDFGVNSGPSRGVKALQSVLGVDADGRVGPDTLKALAVADKKKTIQKLCAKRLSFMQSLKIWNTFKRGWSARVADVEAKAVAMWLANSGTPVESRKIELDVEADKAAGKAKTQSQGAGGAVAGGTGAGGSDAAMSGEPNWLLIAGIAAVVVVVVAVLVIKSRQSKERAAAYKAVAASA